MSELEVRMADGAQKIQVTPEDVEALVRKVQDLAGTLSDPERAVLATWLGESPEQDDTAGYWMWRTVGTGWQVTVPKASQFNQAETLASSVQKKLDETAAGVIGKI
jgi:hypothetical protein